MRQAREALILKEEMGMANRKEKDGPAVEKRLKISKAQQTILMIVLVASLSLGVCIVLAMHFVKKISFNSEVMKAKDGAISNYEQTIENIGICKKPAGSKYTDAELKACNPNSISSESVPGTLRYKVMEEMAKNRDLESVARKSQDDCIGSDGKKIDYRAKYNTEENEDKKAYYLGMVKMCSSLRVVPDALPSKQNVEALLASLNQIFIISDWDPEALAPSEDAEESIIEGVTPIPVSLSVESTTKKTMNVLNNIERSIRTFDITSASVEWSGNDMLSLNARAQAYYLDVAGIKESEKTVYASKDGQKRAEGGTSGQSTNEEGGSK